MPPITQPRFPTTAGHVLVQPYRHRDRAGAFQLLANLPRLYPEAHVWLERRLDDCIAGTAKCRLAFVGGGRPIAILIETPKGRRRMKLSTLFVEESHRGLGVASLLLTRARDEWVRAEIEQVDLTVDEQHSGQLLPLLTRFQFAPVAVERDRYREGRDEMIITWRSGSYGADGPDVDPTDLRLGSV